MITVSLKRHVRNPEGRAEEAFDALNDLLKGKHLSNFSPRLQSDGNGVYQLSLVSENPEGEKLLLSEVKKRLKHMPVEITQNAEQAHAVR